MKQTWYDEDTGNYFEPQFHNARQPAIEYVDWKKRTLYDGREELLRRNLPTIGAKADVVARLEASDHQFGKISVPAYDPKLAGGNTLISGQKRARENDPYQVCISRSPNAIDSDTLNGI